MSDFSLLFKRYNSVSNLTNDLNNSVITLKRRGLASQSGVNTNYPALNVSLEEVSKAENTIASILSVLERFYTNQDTNNELYELMDNSMFKNQILNNIEFKTQILEALNKLKSHSNLSGKDLSYIDKFISILDDEAAVLFRKLRVNRE
jgi:hypothetical protein